MRLLNLYSVDLYRQDTLISQLRLSGHCECWMVPFWYCVRSQECRCVYLCGRVSHTEALTRAKQSLWTVR